MPMLKRGFFKLKLTATGEGHNDWILTVKILSLIKKCIYSIINQKCQYVLIQRGTKKDGGVVMIRKCHRCMDIPNKNTRFDGDFSVFSKGIKIKIK